MIALAFQTIDEAKLNFDESSLLLLNVLIGLMMLGMALDLDVEDFRRLVRKPKPPAIGLIAQFLLLPALTFVLTLVLDIRPSIALGMILVASCPGNRSSRNHEGLKSLGRTRRSHRGGDNSGPEARNSLDPCSMSPTHAPDLRNVPIPLRQRPVTDQPR